MTSDYLAGRLAGCPVSDRDCPALSALSDATGMDRSALSCAWSCQLRGQPRDTRCGIEGDAMGGSDSDYQFGSGENELARLEVQGRAFGPATRMIFAEAGIRLG